MTTASFEAEVANEDASKRRGLAQFGQPSPHYLVRVAAHGNAKTDRLASAGVAMEYGGHVDIAPVDTGTPETNQA